MIQPTKNTYQNDLILQGLFYFPMMAFYLIGFLSSEFFILGALVQFFVGVVQVLSGAFHAVRYEDKQHKNYFIFAIGYLMFLFLGGMLLSSLHTYYPGFEMIGLFFLFIVPPGIATWYYRLTWEAYKNADIGIGRKLSKETFQEDILDDAML